MSSPSVAPGRSSMSAVAHDRGAVIGLVSLAIAMVALVVASRISFSLFYVAAAAVLLALAFLSYRMPRIMLVAVVFTPIVDRYLVNLLIPESLHGISNYLSEALLALVATSIGIRSLRDGTLLPALRHPVVAFVAAFVLLGALSAVLNGVPPVIAAAGIVFTVEAVALFVLPRAVDISLGYARSAVLGFIGLATVAAVLALGQVLLHADLLGLESFTGRFAEGQRVAAFLVNPNMLGVILGMAIPVPLLATVSAVGWRGRISWGALAFILCLALFYTFSRGAWLGLGVAMVVIGLALDPRSLLLLVVFGFVCYGSAYVLPRHVLQPDPGDADFDPGQATIGRLDSLDDGSDLRVLFFKNAAPIIVDHPVIGAGPGRYGGAVAWRFGSPLYDEYTDGSVPRDRTVDSFWLHLTAEFGILGSLLLASSILVALRGVLGRARRATGWARLVIAGAAGMALIVAIDSLVEMLLEGNTTSFPVWFFLGVATVIAGSAAGREMAGAEIEG